MTTAKKMGRASREDAALTTGAECIGNSAESQRMRLLDALRKGPVTTLEARRDLDVLMPAARVFELRHLGRNIQTIRVEQATDAGRTHNVAKYLLMPDAQSDLFADIDGTN